MVEESNHTSRTKNKIIEVLKAINKHRSIWKAREENKYSSSCFNRYLKQIREFGVNPVTIPAKWEIKSLKNILTFMRYFQVLTLLELRNVSIESTLLIHSLAL